MEKTQGMTKLIYLISGLIISVCILSSCAAVQKGLNITIAKAACNLSKPGMAQVQNTIETMEKLHCAYGTTMKFIISESGLTPNIVHGGTDLCHRITFAICPSQASATYKARIERLIIFKGKRLTVYTSNKELNPGTWDMDVKIPVPEDAKPGKYSVKTIFSIGGNSYERIDEFEVLDRRR
jgi:hypothetical protein